VRPDDSPTASIVIPAHNEERAIASLLEQLLADAGPGEFDVLVMCNGCTDRTSELARQFEPAVRVVDVPEPSKRAAIKQADSLASAFPRLYIDADVGIGTADVRALRDGLVAEVLVAAPTRVIPRDGVARLVRAYYDVWEELPQVRAAPFGRGVVALSRSGHERIRDLPPMMSDDLAMTAEFAAHERVVIADARVVVWPPRTMRDLVGRRVRVYTGNDQFDQARGRSAELTTSPRDLMAILRRRPALTPKVVVFIGVSVFAKFAARKAIRSGDYQTWRRDESSRVR
jgi:glycosyltransferase involved in cell wall biosynthesis